MFTKRYSKKRCRTILHETYSWYSKKKNSLDPSLAALIESKLRGLEEAIFDNNREKAKKLAEEIDTLTAPHKKRGLFAYCAELLIAIAVALAVATVVRQCWFENYEIPTGSMRPSFREHDHLVVTKTTFGINVPITAKQFYFDPELVKRAKVVIFTAEGLPLSDLDTSYFWIIPYKKRFVKRMIGKPGDTLYFYGGMIYGIDKDDQPIAELLEDPWMQKLEHIPFMQFEGEKEALSPYETLYEPMHQPIAKMRALASRQTLGEIQVDHQWKKEQPFVSPKDRYELLSYSDFWGIGNFAMAKLLTKREIATHTRLSTQSLKDAPLYLYLRHTPYLSSSAPIHPLFRGALPTLETVIPLTEQHIQRIAENLYTSRFGVKNGHPFGYGYESISYPEKLPTFFDVPNGMYEFYHGKAESVGWKGALSALPQEHPLYKKEPAHIQALFNLGISFYQDISPHRYAYFRDGDLYLMGAPILKKDDPTLIAFLEAEKLREEKATATSPYLAFRDWGAPLNSDGSFDLKKIQTYGIKIPEGQYLVLGDNHANSSDSRVFGFVPAENLRGSPTWIFWPFGPRWGWPPQTPYPLFVLPRIIIWSVAIAATLLALYLSARNRNRRLFPKEPPSGDHSTL